MITARRAASLCLFADVFLTLQAESAGPDSRIPTPPRSVTAPQGTAGGPVDIADLLSTVRLGGASWSPDGQHILCTGNASGRSNLWLMNADGTRAHQLRRSDEEYEKSLLGSPVKDRAKYEAASPIQFLPQGACPARCYAGRARYPCAA